MVLIDKMASGQKEAIQQGLYHFGAFQRANALVFAARYTLKDHAIVSRARALENEDICLFGYNAGYMVSDFAKAYLHLIGAKEYSGTREEVKALIMCKMVFD